MNYPGSFEFAEDTFSGVVGNLEEACSLLGHLGDTHIQHCLLRHCLDACRVTHLLRAVDCHPFNGVIQRAATIIRDCLGVIMGTGLSDAQWAHARLPIKQSR